jgi:hypothetical protein
MRRQEHCIEAWRVGEIPSIKQQIPNQPALFQRINRLAGKFKSSKYE